jgi:hypothetical protein
MHGLMITARVEWVKSDFAETDIVENRDGP